MAATATPSFGIASGTYYAPQRVTIVDANSAAVIHYTTNGTTPTSGSTVYAGSFTVGSASAASTTVIKAIAVAAGISSATNTATYKIFASATPTFSSGTGTYHTPQAITISDATSGAVIYYTTNGSTPTTASAVYSSPLTIGSTTTLKAIAVCPSGPPSAAASATFTISGALTTPTFSTGTGTYHTPQAVRISEAATGTTLYYTTNGSTPTTASTVYSGPVTVGSTAAGTTTTLKAIAVVPGRSTSAVASAAYTVAPALAPVLKLAPGTYMNTASVSLTDGTSGAVIYYTTNGTTPTASSAVYSGAITLSNSKTFSSTTTLKAVAIYPGGPPSAVVSGSYSIMSESTPVRSANSSATFFGMNVGGLLDGTPWPEVPVGTLRIMTGGTSWYYVSPAHGTYNWTNLDREISLARANGAQMLYTFDGTPPWAIAKGLAITEISRSGGVVTVTTAEPHNLYYNPEFGLTQQTTVTIAGVANSGYNGTFGITGSPTATTLTFTQAGVDSSSSGGTLSANCGGNMAPSACAEAPQSLSSWDDYVSALIDHIGPGVIQYWELWNEPNIAETWHGSQATLVAMAADARAILKKADPNAIILSPAPTINFETPVECATKDLRCGSKWITEWLAAGGKNTIDGLAFHGYPQGGEGAELIQGVVALQQLALNQNGIGSLPIFDTESSWGLNTKLPAESDQVAFVARHFLLEHSMGVQRTFWYAYDSSIWGALWSSTGGLNAVGQAEQQVAKWIVGSTLTQPCAPTASGATTYTCAYSRSGGYTALAVWNTAGETTFVVPQGMVQYHDLGGNVASVSSGKVEISTSPILLENKTAF